MNHGVFNGPNHEPRLFKKKPKHCIETSGNVLVSRLDLKSVWDVEQCSTKDIRKNERFIGKTIGEFCNKTTMRILILFIG